MRWIMVYVATVHPSIHMRFKRKLMVRDAAQDARMVPETSTKKAGSQSGS